MRFRLKIFSILILLFLALFIYILEEWVVHYVVLVQCDWPQLDPKNEDMAVPKSNHTPVRVMLLTDTHLFGPCEGFWLERVRTDWQMYIAFQTAVKLHRPEIVFVLGDLTNEGQYSSDDYFKTYVKRFYDVFDVPKTIQMFVLVGNHDVGFHYSISKHLLSRFNKQFSTKDVQLMNIGGNYFVTVNSIGLERDDCFLCSEVDQQLEKLEKLLNCTKGDTSLNCTNKLNSYSRPILLLHFPLFRDSDRKCNEPDEAPYSTKIEPFKEAWDCLSKNATGRILRQINPRLVINGHSHHGCTNKLPNSDGLEITLPSFNWAHKNNPSYGLVVVTPNNYAFSKCLMPRQSSSIIRYVFAIICLFGGIYYGCYGKGKIRRRYSTLA